MEVVTLSAQSREPNGKKGTRELRAQGLVPAVIYGGEDVTHISFIPKAIKSLVYTPDFKLAEIEVNGKTEKCILKDISFHPVTDEIVHVDFLRIMDGVPIKVELPIRFVGESPGVKLGGSLIPQLRKIKIKTLPANLVDSLEVDISGLALGDSARIREITKVDGIEIMVDGSTPVALVEVPRALRSDETAEEEEEGTVVATPEGEATEGVASEEK